MIKFTNTQIKEEDKEDSKFWVCDLCLKPPKDRIEILVEGGVFITRIQNILWLVFCNEVCLNMYILTYGEHSSYYELSYNYFGQKRLRHNPETKQKIRYNLETEQWETSHDKI